MRLKSFRVQNYRSITDSGDIDVGQLTTLVGRNESGKSNLLRALYSLNPSDGSEVLNKEKDFPRHSDPEDCTNNTKAIFTVWELDDEDRESIGELWERGKNVTTAIVSRNYGNYLAVGFEGVVAAEFDFDTIKDKVHKIVPAVKATAANLDEAVRTPIEKAADKFKEDTVASSGVYSWSRKVAPALDALRQILNSAGAEIFESHDAHITELERLTEAISSDWDSQMKADKWVTENLPIFMYLEEYPEFNGYQNIAEFLRQQEQGNLTPSGKNFEKICKVAELQPEELHKLHRENKSEARNNLANHASKKITDEIRRLWKNQSLDINFNLDGEHINTFVSKSKADSKVEINLDERGRGFKWFFSFYITFAADTKGGEAENAILLLDEPGLHLHAKAQRDLLNLLEKGFKNQILYTTHSPFMVPTHRLDIVRTVENSDEFGTTVSDKLSNDANTLFPLQAALGYDLAQSLFIGPHNLVVEGPTDFWVLASMSEYLNGTGRNGLNSKIIITPAGGAQKIPYMVNLLSSQKLNVMVLLDNEDRARGTKEELLESKLIKDKNVIFISDASNSSTPQEADIEDLLDPKVYEKLVRESYEEELKDVSLKLNNKRTRIAKRFEEAFDSAELLFFKTRPMRLLLKKMGTSPDEIVTDEVAKRFETLFKIINNRFFPKG